MKIWKFLGQAVGFALATGLAYEGWAMDPVMVAYDIGTVFDEGNKNLIYNLGIVVMDFVHCDFPLVDLCRAILGAIGLFKHKDTIKRVFEDKAVRRFIEPRIKSQFTAPKVRALVGGNLKLRKLIDDNYKISPLISANKGQPGPLVRKLIHK